MRMQTNQQSGFTLVEMVTVIVITGIIGGMVAMFIQAPVRGYVDSARRAEMTDIADTAVRRLARDIRTAVPNSLRLPAPACIATAATPCYVEFLPTKDGGRYRALQDCTGACTGDVLNFGVADGSFDIVGSPITFVAGDQIVIGSTQSNGNPPYDTSAAGIRRTYTGVAGAQTTVNFTATAFPVWAELPSQRFDVVDGAQGAVTYACVGAATNANGDGAGFLNRYAAYGYNLAQVAPAGLGVPAVLADRLSACSITYNAVSQRNGLLEINLSITRDNETVRLYQAIHVNNAP
jgi:MSHA biogenesis protein MshO